MTTHVVKIQPAQFPKGAPALIYNETRTIHAQWNLGPEVRKLMGDRPKIYARVSIAGGKLTVLEVLPEQPW